ncbi:hypothetical protein BB558_001567 [Smittium angustum]|uniref:AB hydrolase-1 domain-containing protein n=1 Tax=Smittium angustum TaxID=133377 RepID=A0A2U1JB08_SMIAN|nr:hypothetical protein BB558_001567 [Smittium angustum]
MIPSKIILNGHLKGSKIAANVYSIQSKASKSGKKAITIIVAHANGFHKELYEPMIRNILERISNVVNENIYYEKIVSVDFYSQGDSDWLDYSRDLITIVDQLSLSSGQTIGIGNSLGACSMLAAEIMRPSLFKSIIAMEPTVRALPRKGASVSPLTEATLKRKNEFKSKEEFKDYLKSKSFFKAWTDEIIDLHVEYGLTKDFSDGKDIWKLKCDPIIEANTYNGSGNALYMYANKAELIQCPLVLVRGMVSTFT